MPSTVEEIRAELTFAIGSIEALLGQRDLAGSAFLNAALRALREIEFLLPDRHPHGRAQIVVLPSGARERREARGSVR